MAKVTMAVGIPGSVVDADGVLIPWAALKNVDQAELVAADDINVFARAFVEGLFERIQALPSADRPVRMTILQGTQTTVPGLRNALNNPYTINFVITSDNTFEVLAES